MLDTLEAVLEQLQAARPEVADEIQALQAIFSDESLQLYEGKPWQSGQTCVKCEQAITYHLTREDPVFGSNYKLACPAMKMYRSP